MLDARKCHGAAVMEGKLYVMGGSDQQLSVLTAEVLDLSLPEDQWSWRPIAPLPTWHNGNYAPVINNSILLPVAYGSDTDKTYNPVTDMWLGWEGREAPRESRDRPGVGVVGDTVYLVGGASTRTLLDIVEKWDGTNWNRCAPLNIARLEWMTLIIAFLITCVFSREGPGVVGHGGRLYVIGGRGSGGSVESYDPEADTWDLLDIKVGCPEQEYSAVILDRIV